MGEGFASAQDGAVSVDSNTGTVEDLQRELGTEVATQDADGRRGSKPAEPPAAAEGDGEELESDGAAAGASAQAEGGKPGKRRSIQARISDLTREKYETARERDAARLELADLRKQLEELRPAAKGGEAAAAVGKEGVKPAAVADDQTFPKYAEWLQAGNDGELEDWIEARDKWKEDRATAASTAAAERTEQSARFTKIAATFNERMAPVLESDPKFYDAIDPRLTETPAASALPKGVKPTFGNFLVEQVVKSEYPAELLRHLSDKKVIQRLVTLQPDDVIREIARFELTLGDPAAQRSGPAGRATDDDGDDDEESRGAGAIPTSRAHPPAKPVRGSSHEHKSPDEEPGEDASDDDWYRWERRRQTRSASA